MITTHRPINTAPACVWFETPERADWTFGNGHSGEGHAVAVTYTEPGVYYVEARQDGGAVFSDIVTVTAWQGATWAVSTNANVAAERHFTTLQAALNAYNGGAVQILLRRGETYTITAFEDLKAGLRLGAFGTGPRPVVQSSVDMFKRCRGVIQVSGIEFAGPWDASTCTGAAPTAFVATDTGDMVFSDCAFRGLGIAANLQAIGGSFAMDRCSITNWQNYGILGGKTFLFAVTNSDIQQAADALPGPLNKHGPIRITSPQGASVVANCYLRSLNGWSTAGPAQAHQACLRWNVEGVAGARLTFAGNICEGGWSVLDLFGNTSTAQDVPSPALIKGNTLIGTANTFTAIRLGHSGAVIRDNVIAFPDPVSETNKQRLYAFEWDMDNSSPDNTLLTIIEGNEVSGVADILGPIPAGQAVTHSNNGEAPPASLAPVTVTLPAEIQLTFTPHSSRFWRRHSRPAHGAIDMLGLMGLRLGYSSVGGSGVFYTVPQEFTYVSGLKKYAALYDMAAADWEGAAAWQTANPSGTDVEFMAAFPDWPIRQGSSGAPALVGDLVGLEIDQLQGALRAIGSNVVTNGTFGTDSDWTKGTGWAISGGKAEHTGTTSGNLTQDCLTVNTLYKITTSISGGTSHLYAGVSTYVFNQTGEVTQYLQCLGSTSIILQSAVDGVDVDDVIARPIPGIHATQTTTGNLPAVSTSGGQYFLAYDGTDQMVSRLTGGDYTWAQKTASGSWVYTDVSASGATNRPKTAQAVLTYVCSPQLVDLEKGILEGTIDPSDIDVFLLIGQSNMRGNATFDGGDDYPADCYQFGQSNSVTEAVHPLDHHDPVADNMGLAVQFVIDYMDENPSRYVIVVPRAQGSTSFSGGHWGVGDTLYQDAVDDTNALLAALPGAVFKAVLFHMGENDSIATDGTAFASELSAMVAGIRSEITGASSVPFVCGEMAQSLDPGTFGGAGVINAALKDAPNQIASAGWAASNNLTGGLHFDAASLRVFGSRYLDALKEAQGIYGPELVESDGWSLSGSGMSVTNGIVSHAGTTQGTAAQNILEGNGITYRLRATISGGTVTIYCGASTFLFNQTGEIDVEMTSASFSLGLAFQTATDGVTVTNVSLRRVL